MSNLEAIEQRHDKRALRQAERLATQQAEVERLARQREIRAAANDLAELCRDEVTAETITPILERLSAAVRADPEAISLWREGAERLAGIQSTNGIVGDLIDGDVTAADAADLIAAALDGNAPQAAAKIAQAAGSLAEAASVLAVAAAALGRVDTFNNYRLNQLVGCQTKNLIVETVLRPRQPATVASEPTAEVETEPATVVDGRTPPEASGEKPPCDSEDEPSATSDSTPREPSAVSRKAIIRAIEKAEKPLSQKAIQRATGYKMPTIKGATPWMIDNGELLWDSRGFRLPGQV